MLSGDAVFLCGLLISQAMVSPCTKASAVISSSGFFQPLLFPFQPDR